jgi:hypothetical protein
MRDHDFVVIRDCMPGISAIAHIQDRPGTSAKLSDTAIFQEYRTHAY